MQRCFSSSTSRWSGEAAEDAERRVLVEELVDAVTVFRKLSELEYRTSYSHRGRYYTLDELALGMVLIGQDERLREAIRRQLATARRATSRRREPAG